MKYLSYHNQLPSKQTQHQQNKVTPPTLFINSRQHTFYPFKYYWQLFTYSLGGMFRYVFYFLEDVYYELEAETMQSTRRHKYLAFKMCLGTLALLITSTVGGNMLASHEQVGHSSDNEPLVKIENFHGYNHRNGSINTFHQKKHHQKVYRYSIPPTLEGAEKVYQQNKKDK